MDIAIGFGKIDRESSRGTEEIDRLERGFDDAGGEEPDLGVRCDEVEMVDSISESVEVGMDGGLLTDIEDERVTALRFVTRGLHAEFGQPFRDGFGVGELRFVLDFENHNRCLVTTENKAGPIESEEVVESIERVLFPDGEDHLRTSGLDGLEEGPEISSENFGGLGVFQFEEGPSEQSSGASSAIGF